MLSNDNFWGDAHDYESEIAPGHLSRRHTNRALRRHEIALAVLALGTAVCFGGKGGGDAPAPDPRIGIAALKNAELGEEWLGFAREQFEVGNVRQEEMDDLTKTVIEQQLATQDRANAWAQEDRQRYKDTFQPLEDNFAKEAAEYGSAANQAKAAGEARADVMKASAVQDQVAQRSAAAMGLDPRSGRFAGMDRATDTATALAAAGGANAARTMVKDKGLALRADAINIGKGLPSQSAAAAGLGLNAGNSAIGNQGAANANWFQNNQVMTQGFQGGMQGYSNQGNILSNLYGKQVDAWGQQQQANATSAAGVGSMVGTIAGAGLMAF